MWVTQMLSHILNIWQSHCQWVSESINEPINELFDIRQPTNDVKHNSWNIEASIFTNLLSFTTALWFHMVTQDEVEPWMFCELFIHRIYYPNSISFDPVHHMYFTLQIYWWHPLFALSTDPDPTMHGDLSQGRWSCVHQKPAIVQLWAGTSVQPLGSQLQFKGSLSQTRSCLVTKLEERLSVDGLTGSICRIDMFFSSWGRPVRWSNLTSKMRSL